MRDKCANFERVPAFAGTTAVSAACNVQLQNVDAIVIGAGAAGMCALRWPDSAVGASC